MWIRKIYSFCSFCFLVLSFLIVYFMVDMLIMTIRLEDSVKDMFLSYIRWVYLYISALSMFLLHKGLYIYIFLFIVTNFYSLRKNKVICIESISYIITIIFTVLANYIQKSFINTQIYLVNKSSIQNILVGFNYTASGIIINMCNMIVLIILLIVNIRYAKKQRSEREVF